MDKNMFDKLVYTCNNKNKNLTTIPFLWIAKTTLLWIAKTISLYG